MIYRDSEFKRSIRKEIIEENMKNMEGPELERWANNAFLEWRDKCLVPSDWDYWFEDAPV